MANSNENYLNKREKMLMTIIYSDAVKKNGVCKIKPVELLMRIPFDMEFSYDELETALQGLVDDEYIELVETEKKGEPYFAITLLKRGKAFKRELTNDKRALRRNLALKVVLAVVAGIIGLLFFLLRKLF